MSLSRESKGRLRAGRDAEARVAGEEGSDEAQAREAMDWFGQFVRLQNIGTGAADVQHLLELSPSEYDAYEQAWDAVQAVYRAVNSKAVAT